MTPANDQALDIIDRSTGAENTAIMFSFIVTP
jgi:hypothetical protein